jgi:amidase
MARSARDLRLELEVVTTPAPGELSRFSVSFPPARATRLEDYRIGYVVDDPFCPLSPEVKEPMMQAIESLRKSGANLIEGWPDGYEPGKAFDLYLVLLAAAFSDAISAEEREILRSNLESAWGGYARGWLKGSSMSHSEWRALSGRRIGTRALWQRYFGKYDAFLMPVNMVPAFPHNHELSFFERILTTSSGPRQYGDMLRWISPATLTGCPATVAPAGKTSTGLPVGIQIMGPYLEDMTTIGLAECLGDVLGGFSPPPQFA